MNYQRGVSISGLIYWGILLALLALLGMKVAPSVIEYYQTLAAAKKVVSAAQPGATVMDLRKAYDRFADIDRLDLKSSELEITKEGGQVVISFAYDKKIPLFGPASLLIEYEGSTSGSSKD